ncbi:MAG: NADH-quinone oxidoreductase subunit NuoN [Burkholderiales bacterium]|nr:NADH-quinone oxidoreductase subunit NuoN [Burkholderiales bacterium]GIK87816.1 MAG: NADH-quinone oxidoreductase subunit N [Betaproteobacteria bacterium]
MLATLAPVMPEIVLLSAACAILVIDLFLDEPRRKVSYWLAQAALLGTAWYVLATAHAAPAKGFGNMVVDDMLSDLLKLAALLCVSAGLFYGRQYFALRGLFRGETFVLTLFATLGMMVMISANSFLVLYLGLELMSLSLYALVALHRTQAAAAEAAMKYFVLGAMASGLFLYGTSMIYGATGSFDIDAVMRATLDGPANRILLVFGLVFVLSGIAFKLGAVPYHMWVPDVYHGAPTPVTLLIGTAPKLAAFALTLRVLAGALAGIEFDWQGMLIVLSLLSMIVGNVVAIAQSNVKRMLAYSTIANMGYMLMGFLAADLNGLSAALFYAITYVLTSLASFGVILLLSREGFECDALDDLRGLNQRSPWWAFIMLLVMFSLAGIPPTVGFYAKFAVIEAAVNAQFVWLAVVAVLASLVGAFYYLRVVKLMYFDEPVDRSAIEARGDARAILSLNGLALLALGILPQPLMGLCVVALTQSKFL